MASFGDAVTAGLLNASAPAMAAFGGVHRAAHVSAGAVTIVRFIANLCSLAALLVPVYTYIVPVYKAKGVGDRKIHGMIGVFYGAMFWIFYAIPEKHRNIFTLVVNSVAVVSQMVYIGFYLRYAEHEKKQFAKFLLSIFAPLAVLVAVLFVLVLDVGHVWSRKIAGIFVPTISTGMFAVGAIDVVMLVLHQTSPFSRLQLWINLGAARIWTAYAFLFKPLNFYTAVPNITGVSVTSAQIISHVALARWKKGKQPAGAGAGNNMA